MKDWKKRMGNFIFPGIFPERGGFFEKLFLSFEISPRVFPRIFDVAAWPRNFPEKRSGNGQDCLGGNGGEGGWGGVIEMPDPWPPCTRPPLFRGRASFKSRSWRGAPALSFGQATPFAVSGTTLAVGRQFDTWSWTCSLIYISVDFSFFGIHTARIKLNNTRSALHGL